MTRAKKKWAIRGTGGVPRPGRSGGAKRRRQDETEVNRVLDEWNSMLD